MNPKLVITEWEGTHPNHYQEGTDGTKYSLGWCDASHFLREVEGFDSHVQRGYDTVPTF